MGDAETPLSDMAIRSAARVVIPHRGLWAGKSRLASALNPKARFSLSEHMLGRVAEAARAVVDDVQLISPDPLLREPASSLGLHFVLQRGRGLNEACEQARSQAASDGVSVLAIISGDLPNVSEVDVAALLCAAERGDPPALAIAPDARGTGTNGLALRLPAPITFHFGPDSRSAHIMEAERANTVWSIVSTPALAHDIDTPSDYHTWLRSSGRSAALSGATVSEAL